LLHPGTVYGLNAMATSDSVMASELRQAPDVVRAQPPLLSQPVSQLIKRCRRNPPDLVVTCARGSSAHAATFAKHLIERHLGIPVAAAAPNIATVYRRRLHLKGQLLLTISQSGRSDDLTEFAIMAKAAGAQTAAIVNDTQSPLAKACETVLPMAAGAERSVAATKSFVASLAVLLRLAAEWLDGNALRAAIERLPDRLAAAAGLDWSAALTALAETESLVTIGRGPTLAIAREAALKLKETCNIHAEAFSGAEFQHGPVALVSPRYPVLILMPGDEAATGLRQLTLDLREKGAVVFATDHDAPTDSRLPAVPADNPDTDAVCLIQTFYAMAVEIAGRRGMDVDRPRHLQKVTRTR
jgi:glutamine---fructose-6-phosphate transaminase (isomerizing)